MVSISTPITLTCVYLQIHTMTIKATLYDVLAQKSYRDGGIAFRLH